MKSWARRLSSTTIPTITGPSLPGIPANDWPAVSFSGQGTDIFGKNIGSTDFVKELDQIAIK
jgi:hypothetical protein